MKPPKHPGRKQRRRKRAYIREATKYATTYCVLGVAVEAGRELLGLGVSEYSALVKIKNYK